MTNLAYLYVLSGETGVIDMNKKYTAKQFHDAPGEVYQDAREIAKDGGCVEIHHDRHKKHVFELTARERGCNWDTKGDPIDNPTFPRVSE